MRLRYRSSPGSFADAAGLASSRRPSAGLCQCRCRVGVLGPTRRRTVWRSGGGRGRAWPPADPFEAPCALDADRAHPRLLAPRGWRAATSRVRACASRRLLWMGVLGPTRRRPVRRWAWASVDVRRRVRSAVRRRCRSIPGSLAGETGLASSGRRRPSAGPPRPCAMAICWHVHLRCVLYINHIPPRSDGEVSIAKEFQIYAVLNTTKHDVCALVNSTIYELNRPQVKPRASATL